MKRTSEQYMKNGMERLLKDNVALINDEDLQEVCCYCDDYVVEHDYSDCKDCINFKFYCELAERRLAEDEAKWNKIEDLKPDSSGTYLVTIKDTGITTENLMKQINTPSWPSPKFKTRVYTTTRFYDFEQNSWNGRTYGNDDITAWSTLPEPYNEVD